MRFNNNGKKTFDSRRIRRWKNPNSSTDAVRFNKYITYTLISNETIILLIIMFGRRNTRIHNGILDIYIYISLRHDGKYFQRL